MKIRKRVAILLVLCVASVSFSRANSPVDDPCEQMCAGAFNTCVVNAGEAEDACFTQAEFARGQCYLNAAGWYYDCVSFFTTVFPGFAGYEQICLNIEFELEAQCETNANNAGAICQNTYSTAYEGCANAYTHCVGACPTPTPAP